MVFFDDNFRGDNFRVDFNHSFGSSKQRNVVYHSWDRFKIRRQRSIFRLCGSLFTDASNFDIWDFGLHNSDFKIQMGVWNEEGISGRVFQDEWPKCTFKFGPRWLSDDELKRHFDYGVVSTRVSLDKTTCRGIKLARSWGWDGCYACGKNR